MGSNGGTTRSMRSSHSSALGSSRGRQRTSPSARRPRRSDRAGWSCPSRGRRHPWGAVPLGGGLSGKKLRSAMTSASGMVHLVSGKGRAGCWGAGRRSGAPTAGVHGSTRSADVLSSELPLGSVMDSPSTDNMSADEVAPASGLPAERAPTLAARPFPAIRGAGGCGCRRGHVRRPLPGVAQRCTTRQRLVESVAERDQGVDHRLVTDLGAPQGADVVGSGTHRGGDGTSGAEFCGNTFGQAAEEHSRGSTGRLGERPAGDADGGRDRRRSTAGDGPPRRTQSGHERLAVVTVAGVCVEAPQLLFRLLDPLEERDERGVHRIVGDRSVRRRDRHLAQRRRPGFADERRGPWSDDVCVGRAAGRPVVELGQVVIEPEQRERASGHVERRRQRVDDDVVDVESGLDQLRLDPAVEHEELFPTGASERVDEQRDPPLGPRWCGREDARCQELGNLVGPTQRCGPNARLAVYAEPTSISPAATENNGSLCPGNVQPSKATPKERTSVFARSATSRHPRDHVRRSPRRRRS
jgi:hypothetical protein